MRTFLIASAGLALMAGGSAEAQRGGAAGPTAMPRANPGMGYRPGPMVRPGRIDQGRNRWGSKVGGRWWGGANAPGGWAAYRQPYRGWALPAYWNSPRFYISDWSGYGLVQPQPGYNWVRYYDDAVLVDGRGSVYDSADGIDWDGYGYGDAYAAGDARAYASPDDRGYGTSYETPRYERRSTSDGVGGAVVGAAVGGVAGNLIAGRGNRLGGTLIGAGVGAAAGYGVDRAANTRTVPVAPPPPPPPPPGAGYGAPAFDHGGYDRDGYDRGGYGVPVAPRRAPPPPPPRVRDWNGDGRTIVTTSSGRYGGNTYYYPGGSTTTIVVQPQPVVTTTTTTTYEDVVTYSRPTVRTKRLYRSKLLRRAPTCNCR